MEVGFVRFWYHILWHVRIKHIEKHRCLEYNGDQGLLTCIHLFYPIATAIYGCWYLENFFLTGVTQ